MDKYMKYLEQGVHWEDEGNYDRAIADYTKAIEWIPNYFEAYLRRGNAYIGKNDYDRAIADSTKAIELNPKCDEAYLVRGFAYINKGDYDRAIADSTKAIESDPKYDKAYRVRGLAYDIKGDYSRAIADFSKAIEIDPRNGMSYGLRATSYYNQELYDWAWMDIKKAQSLGSQVPPSEFNRMLEASGLALELMAKFPRFKLDVPQDTVARRYLGIAQGGKFTVPQIKAQIVIIELFNMYCPYSQRVASQVNEMYEGIQNRSDLRKKVKIIGIALGNTQSEVDFFRNRYKVPFPLFPDPDQLIYKALESPWRDMWPAFICIEADKDADGSQEAFYIKIYSRYINRWLIYPPYNFRSEEQKSRLKFIEGLLILK